MFCRWPASSLAGVPSLLGVKGGLQGLERGEVWGKSKTQRARHRGHLVAWKKARWEAKRLLGHRYEGGKRVQGGGGGRADGDERELLEELLTGHMLRAARGLRRLKFDPLKVLDVLSLDARLLLEEGGGAKEKTVRWFRGPQVGRGQVGGHAQGRGSPRVHPGLQDPVALSSDASSSSMTMSLAMLPLLLAWECLVSRVDGLSIAFHPM